MLCPRILKIIFHFILTCHYTLKATSAFNKNWNIDFYYAIEDKTKEEEWFKRIAKNYDRILRISYPTYNFWAHSKKIARFAVDSNYRYCLIYLVSIP